MTNRKQNAKTDVKAKVEEPIEWRETLKSLEINDEDWRCHVSFLVETAVEDQQYLQMFNETVIGGTRKCLKSITMTDLLVKIKTYANDLKAGRSSAGLPEPLNSYSKACAEAMTFSNKSGTFSIPNELLSKLIRYEVLRLKYEWILITQREVLLKKEIANEFDSMMRTKACTATTGKNVNVVDKRSSKKSVSSKSGKTNTKLHKRGEEWKDIKFVVDSPTEGPQLYIVISGFYDMDLLLTILNSDIPVISIIQLNTEMKMVGGEQWRHSSNGKDLKKSVRASAVPVNDVNQIYDQFWNCLSSNLNNYESSKLFGNIAFITYCPSQVEATIDANLTEEDIGTEKKKLIFDQISFLMYDIQDMTREHINYLRHMNVKSMSDESPAVNIEEFDTYNRIVDSIPSECVTVPVILHGLLEEVCARGKKHRSKNETDDMIKVLPNAKEHTVRKSIQSTTRHKTISNQRIINTSSLSQEKEELMLKPFKKYEPRGYHKKLLNLFENSQTKCLKKMERAPEIEIIPPKVIPYGSLIELLSYHLNNLPVNLLEITTSVLENYVVPLLWNRISLLKGETIISKRHFSKLVNSKASDIQEDTKRYSIALKVIENLQCRVSKETPLVSACEYLKYRSMKYAVVGNEQPRVNLKSDIKDVKRHEMNLDSDELIKCPEIVCLKDTDEVCTCSNFDMQEFNVVEQFSRSSLLQLLFEIMTVYECIDYFYFGPGDFFILVCHDNHSSTYGVTVTDWMSKITTPVCLRDFVNYVLREEVGWIREQDEKFEQMCRQEDENMKKLMNSTPSQEDSVINLELNEATFTLTDYLVPGSIKIKKYMHLFQETPSKAKTKAGTKKDQKNLKASTSKNLESIGSFTFKNDLPENSVYRQLSLRTAVEGEPFDFIGYDLGSYRVHTSGTTTNIQSKDGTRITIEKSGWYFFENTLSVKLTKAKHKMYLYSVAESPPKPFRPFNFHIEAANGIIMAFSKTEIPRKSSVEEEAEADVFVPDPICFIGRSIPFKSKESIVEIEEEISSKSHDTVSKVSLNIAVPQKSTDVKKRKSNSISLYTSIPEKMHARVESEKRTHTSLTPKHSLTQPLLKASNYLSTRSQILNMLKEVRTKSFTCYKIISSKLHAYKYLKRIKPHVSICVGSLIRRLVLKPTVKKKSLSEKSVTSREYRFKPKALNRTKHPMNFDFKASWPSGLIIETVPSVIDYDPFYIRQYYISKGPACDAIKNETKRCFLRNGTILIFKEHNRMEILCSDSSIYSCRIGASIPRNSVSNESKDSSSWKGSKSMQMKYKKFRSIAQRKNSKIISGSESLTFAVSRHVYRKQLKHCVSIAKDQLKQNPYLIPIPEYTIITPKGTKCKIRRNRIASFPSKYIVQSATDYFEGETFTERQDGTHSLLNSEGELATSFPDGSRIMTSFVVDETEIFCEFTEEEKNKLIVKYFKIAPEDITQLDEEMVQDLITFEGFLSVHLSCSFEHPNYGAVSYDGLTKSVKISMPGGINIESTLNGDYSGCLDHQTEFSVDCEEIMFRKRLCKYSSTAIINISPFINDGLSVNNNGDRLSTNDVLLENSGSIINDKDPSVYISNIDMFNQRVDITYTGDINISEPVDETSREESKKRKCMIKQLDYRKNHFFLLEKDLTGVEFLSKTEIDKIRSREKPETVSENISDENNKIYKKCITVLKQLDGDYSQKWLMDYKVPKVTPTYLTRTDMKPSTYFPESWLSPLSTDKVEKRTTCFNFQETKLNDNTGAVLKRTFLQLCSKEEPATLKGRNAVDSYIHSVNSEEQDIKTSKYLSEHSVLKDRCSALSFKEKWYLREIECERFKTMLRNFNVPHYFSQQMEEILFDKKSVNHDEEIKQKIAQFVKDKENKEAQNRTTRSKEVDEDRPPYEINLRRLSEEWKKFYTAKKTPQAKPKRKSLIKTDVEAPDSEPDLKIKPVDSFCVCKCVPNEDVLDLQEMVPLRNYIMKKHIVNFGERPRVEEMILQPLENIETDVISCNISECGNLKIDDD